MDWQRRSRVFGTVAHEYDRIRPGYPAALFDDVTAGLEPGAPVLDVGAGTGRATLELASRGFAVTAIEPDPAMAALLRDRATERGTEVSVVTAAFEDVPAHGDAALVVSAQAWHWVDPAVRWDRAADQLRPGGRLALFWNREQFADDALIAVNVAAHRRFAPATTVAAGSKPEAGPDAPDLITHPALTDPRRREYRSSRTLSSADFIALLNTTSECRILADDARNGLFGELLRQLPAEIELACTTDLYTAVRSSTAVD